MSEKKKESITEKKVSRRSMLTWTGALAVAAAAGAVAGYGATELVKPPPPPPISFKPPLSAEVQSKVDAYIKDRIALHSGDTMAYSVACEWPPGGSSTTGRVVKLHLKDGVVTTVEPDDSINPGVAIEDAVVPWQAVMDDQIQHRPVARDLAIQGHLYNPRRLLYPMKRVSGKRGSMDGQFVRISWTEALTTIAQKMKETQEKYSNYSIYQNPVAAWQGCNANGWGSDSTAAHDTARKFTWGVGYGGGTAAEGEITAIYDAKLIVLWGWNAAVTSRDGNTNTAGGYRLRLAKEKGIPIIAIDPVWQDSAALLADQWIPIRVSTDAAMGLAVANVLFKEDLYDKNFVSKFVEPTGFQKFKDYVLGNMAGPDGKRDRTPEWAAPICGVPADTIRTFARLYASKKPVYLDLGNACASKVPRGENAARVCEFLNVMTGNIGVAGTSSSDGSGGGGSFVNFGVNIPIIDLGVTPGKFALPKAPQGAALFINWKFPDAVMLRYKLDRKEITEKEYCNSIGLQPGQPLPNIRMGFDSTSSVTVSNQRPQTNYTYQAISTLDLWVALVSNTMDPASSIADIMLPVAVWPQKDPTFTVVANGFFYMPPLAFAGEAKTVTWIYLQLAKMLGFGDQYSSKLAGIPLNSSAVDPAWDTAFENAAKGAYDTWAKANNVSTSWDDFKKVGFYRYPIGPLSHPPRIAFSDQIQQGKPFPDDTNSAHHVSGKIEFYSDWLASTDMSTTWWGGVIQPTAMWEPVWENYWTPEEFEKYPLLLTSAHAMHRMHNWTDTNALLSDTGAAGEIQGEDVYESALYISPVDAAMRGIKDGDRIRAFNSSGQTILTATVTPKLTPGVVHLPEGRWTNLNKAGVDVRGNANNLTYADRKCPSCAFPHMTICEVERF